MTTKGAYGFYRDGINKISRHAFDSQPHRLGTWIVRFLEKYNLAELNEIFDKIRVVNADDPIDLLTWRKCYPHSENPPNSALTMSDVLSRYQGNLSAVVGQEIFMMVSGGESFLKDSRFCQWGYVINLDDNVLEVYKGHQRIPTSNRYALSRAEIAASRVRNEGRQTQYFNCRLIGILPLEGLSEEDLLEFVSEQKGEANGKVSG